MKRIGEIYHKPGLPLHGRTIAREAVRGIIAEGTRLLMVYSAQVGDYKYPRQPRSAASKESTRFPYPYQGYFLNRKSWATGIEQVNCMKLFDRNTSS